MSELPRRTRTKHTQSVQSTRERLATGFALDQIGKESGESFKPFRTGSFVYRLSSMFKYMPSDYKVKQILGNYAIREKTMNIRNPKLKLKIGDRMFFSAKLFTLSLQTMLFLGEI